jgi:hypothetical protein
MTVRVVEKIPKTKDEIQRLIIAELRTFAQCEKAWGIVVAPIVDDTGVATWTVSRFHRAALSRAEPRSTTSCELPGRRRCSRRTPTVEIYS